MRTAADTFRVDPSDPRAPPQEVWDEMSEEQREQVIASLPSKACRTDEARIREEVEAKLADEIARLEEAIRLRHEGTRRLEEAIRLREEATRRSEEATRRSEDAERKLAEALAEIERLKRGR